VPRRSRNQITKELALKIAKKLEAVNESDPGDEHDTYAVYHNGILVVAFGIRRSSQKNMGHDHIPRELQVGPNFAKQLAQCTKSKREYLEKIGIAQPNGEA
jgi:hypothetical protein